MASWYTEFASEIGALQMHLGCLSMFPRETLDEINNMVQQFKAFYEKESGYNLAGQVPFLSRLAHYYAEKDESWLDLVKAHGLYNSCGIREPENLCWFEKAFEIEKKCLKNFGYSDSKIHFPEHNQTVINLKQNLVNIRNVEKTLLDEIKPLIKDMESWEERDLKNNISEQSKCVPFCKQVQALSVICQKQMILFITDVVKYAIDLTGVPPCEFAVVAMGSLAKCEVTPYSDLEYCFLVEKEEKTPYFETLAVMSYFIINNLRESNIKCFAIEELKDWFMDHAGSGFEIDGFSDLAGNIPTGSCPGSNLLIKTVEHMVAMYEKVYLGSDDEEIGLASSNDIKRKPKDKTSVSGSENKGNLSFPKADLSAIFSSTVLVHGNNSLHEKFRLRIQEITPNPRRAQMSLTMLRNDIKKFDFLPNFSLGEVKRVKKDIFRFPSIILYDLKINFTLSSSSVWNVINDLRKGYVSESFVQSIHFILCIAHYVRLDTYMHYNSQNDEISVLPAVSSERKLAYFPSTLFLKMCSHLIPLKRLISGKKLILEQFKQDVCLNDQELSKAYTCVFMSDYKNCVKKYESHYESISSFTEMEHLVIYIIALMMDGQLHRAHEYLQHQHVMSILPEFLKFQLLGYVQSRLGMHQQAITSFTRRQTLLADETSSLDLAALYMNLGEYDKALSYCRDSNHHFPNKILVLKQKADILVRLGKYSESESLYTQYLAILNIKYGQFTCHPHLAIAYIDFGSSFLEMGRIEDALVYIAKGLEMHKVLYGDEAHSVLIAKSYERIGSAYLFLGRYTESFENHRRALDICISLYGISSPHNDIAVAYYSLGHLYLLTGRLQEALHHCNTALSMYKSLYGDNSYHPYIAKLYIMKGRVFQNIGRYEVGIAYCKAGLKMQKYVYGENACHKDIAISLNQIGILYHVTDRQEEALEYLNKALSMMKSLHRDDHPHPDISTLHINIGLVYQTLGKNDDALVILSKAREILEAIYGEKSYHPNIALILTLSGKILHMKGLPLESIKLYAKAYQMSISQFGVDCCNQYVAVYYNQLGNICYSSGESRAALKHFKKANEIMKTLYGSDALNPNIAITYYNMGHLYRLSGKHGKALACYKKVSEACEKMMHREYTRHIDLAAVYTHIGDLHHKMA